MPQKLFEIETDGRISKFVLSNDWNTRVPWQHKGENLPYFAYKRELSDSKEVDFTYLYLGPFAMISGKWIGGY